jgi:hypothetical protein
MRPYLKNYFLCVIFAIIFFSVLASLKWVTPSYFFIPQNIITVLLILLFPGITRYFLSKSKDFEKPSKNKALGLRLLAYISFLPFILYFTLVLISNWSI